MKGDGKGNGRGLTKADEKKLNPQEAKLVELLADPEDTRSKEDKAVECGFNGKTVYLKERQEHFAVALEKRVNEHMRRIKISRGQVLQALRDRAMQERVVTVDGVAIGLDARDANKAAELFLKVTGDIQSGNHIQVTQVNQNAEVRESRKGRLAAYLAREPVTESSR